MVSVEILSDVGFEGHQPVDIKLRQCRLQVLNAVLELHWVRKVQLLLLQDRLLDQLLELLCQFRDDLRLRMDWVDFILVNKLLNFSHPLAVLLF